MTAALGNFRHRSPAVGRLLLAIAALLGMTWARTAGAQSTTTSTRTYLLDFQIGEAAAVGGQARTLVGSDAVAVNLAFGVEVSRRSWGWVSFDFRPMSSSAEYPGPGFAPGVGMYAITAGMSRKFGRPIGRTRWQPLELGLGAGAARVEIESYGSVGTIGAGTDFPADAQFESPFGAGLISSTRWLPTAAARLRLTVPIGAAFRLSAGASLLATHVGDVRLWDGGWEPTGVGSRYRPTSRVWSFGTTVTAPVTFGLALKL